MARIFSCILFASLQISDRPFGAFLTGRYKSDCRLDDQYPVSPSSMNGTNVEDDKDLPCDPSLYPHYPQPAVLPQGRNSWLPPLPFQQQMTRTQSLHSSRPLLMRSQTAPTSTSSVYSGPSTSSELTICRYPSTTSSFSNLSYSSAVLGLAPSTICQGSTPDLPVIPERYRQHPYRYWGTSSIPDRKRSEVMMPHTTCRTSAPLQNSPCVSQDEIQFWQAGSCGVIPEPLRCRYAASSSSSADITLPRTLRTPSRRSSRTEKRKRSYESLRKGKFTMDNGMLLHTGFEGSLKSPKRRNSGLIVPNEGIISQREPIMRRQSRTLVKKRQPWDSTPRGNGRSRV